MALAALISGAVAFLKFAPTIISAVTGIVTGINAIRKDVNPDVAIRSDVADRIAHINTVIAKIATASGQIVTIPLVLAPSDYPAWQQFASEYIHSWYTNVVQPRFVDPMTRLLLRLPNVRTGDAINPSGVIGYSDVALRAALNALPDGAEKTALVESYNDVVTFLNTYVNVFTAWEGLGSQTLQELTPAEEQMYANDDNWLRKESLLALINDAKSAYMRAMPSQKISHKGSVYAWSPRTWVQGATDFNYIFTEAWTPSAQVVTNINTDNLLYGFATTGIHESNGNNTLLYPTTIASLAAADATTVKGQFLIERDGMLVNQASSILVPYQPQPALVAKYFDDNVAGAVNGCFTTIAFKRYGTQDLSPADAYCRLDQLPKYKLYDWYATIEVQFSGNSDLDCDVMYRTVLLNPANLAQVVYGTPMKRRGAIRGTSDIGIRRNASHFVDLEIDRDFVDTAIANNYTNRIIAFQVLTLISAQRSANGNTPSATSPGWVSIGSAAGQDPRAVAVGIKLQQVAAAPSSLGAAASDLTYVQYDNLNDERAATEDTSFFDLMGSINYSTGEDANFTVYEVWLKRLGEGGISLNMAMRILAEVSDSLSANFIQKYIDVLGATRAAKIFDSQGWLLTRGPFFDGTKPFSRNDILKCLRYLWSDLLTLEYFAGHSSVIKDAIIEARGDLS